MAPLGTVAYEGLTDLPPLVERAVALARPDPARMHWLTHPAVDAVEVRLAPDLAALVVTRRFSS